MLIFTVQEWKRGEQTEWIPEVEFQGDALSDAEKNDIREAVMGEIILEAIPPSERAKAISVALQNEEVANLVFAKGLEEETHSVRRILPETAVKFYAAKTMLSVTWTKLGKRPSVVSALIDPDVWKVVQVWNC